MTRKSWDKIKNVWQWLAFMFGNHPRTTRFLFVFLIAAIVFIVKFSCIDGVPTVNKSPVEFKK